MIKMPDYRTTYLALFKSITDVIEQLKAVKEMSEQEYIQTDADIPMRRALYRKRADMKNANSDMQR